jgi:hypothetical protein
MRFLIMHRTSAHWESGARPTPQLVARVGELIGELHKAGIFLAGEGLRASSQGVRVRFGTDGRQVAPGPFEPGNELPAAFSIVRSDSIDDVVGWASQGADPRSPAELDIRPVTEPWDIGLAEQPANVNTRRFMVLRKATPDSEAGRPVVAQPASGAAARPARRVAPDAREAAAAVPEGNRRQTETAQPASGAGVELLVTERLRPSAKGRRYKNAESGLVVRDGPFAESKELVGGYIIISAATLDDVDPWARRYIAVVGAREVDVRELE